MKIIEAIITCALLAIFSSIASGIIIPCTEIYMKTQQLKSRLDMDRFLAEGFVKLCKEKKEEELKFSLVEWKKMCSDLWQLDYLSIKRDGNGIIESWSLDGKITSVKFSFDE